MTDTTSPIPTLSSSYAPTLDAIDAWYAARRANLASDVIDTLSEIERRIHRLQLDLERLFEINAQLIKATQPQVHLDQETNTLSFQLGGQIHSIKMNRANPDTPVSLCGVATAGSYRAGAVAKNDSAITTKLKSDLEGPLEHYYYNAHRVLKLIQKLPGLRNFKCKEITIVRNKLIEHADHGDIYSFGFGSAGLTVRPMVRPGRAWTDGGLLRNTEAFIDALQSAFSK